MAEANDLECQCAVETFLPGAINHTLTAATDLLQQFIVAKVGQRLCRTRSTALMGQRCYSDRVLILAREQTETGFQQTGAAKFLRRVSENLRPALCTDFSGSRHVDGRTIQRPNKYCRKSSRR